MSIKYGLIIVHMYLGKSKVFVAFVYAISKLQSNRRAHYTKTLYKQFIFRIFCSSSQNNG